MRKATHRRSGRQQCHSMFYSTHNHTILDNDQLDTHLLYFTIRLL